MATQPRPAFGPMLFRIKLRADGLWQWRLLDHFGEVVAQCPKPYANKGECLEAIEKAKKCAGAIALES
jgi:uncharacterized protein YegP (UPF0339 family)